MAGEKCLFDNHLKDGVSCFCPTDEKERTIIKAALKNINKKAAQYFYENSKFWQAVRQLQHKSWPPKWFSDWMRR